MSLARSAERLIEHQSVLKGFLTPAYQGMSVVNVVQTVLQTLGLPAHAPILPEFFDPSLTKDVKHVLLFVADGFGYNLLPRTTFLRKMNGFPITTVMPSTTTTVLSTLASGLTPQEHGILGYRLYLRELGHVTNMLRFGPSLGLGSFADEGIDPQIFFPFPTVSSHLKKKGIKTTIFNKQEYLDSPLSHMIYQSDHMVGYRTLPQLGKLFSTGKDTSFQYAYWDMVDTASHAFGPDAPAVTGEVKALDKFIAHTVEHLPKDTLFLFTADHGLITARGNIQLLHHTDMLEYLAAPPSGEGRLLYLHAKKGREAKLRAYLDDHFAKDALILERADAFAKGLFGTGKVHPEAKERVGHFILIPRGHHHFSFPYLDQREMRGKHGGLSRDEMLVPLCWKRT